MLEGRSHPNIQEPGSNRCKTHGALRSKVVKHDTHWIITHRIASHHTTSHCIASHRMTSHHTASHRIISHHMKWYSIASHHTTSCEFNDNITHDSVSPTTCIRLYQNTTISARCSTAPYHTHPTLPHSSGEHDTQHGIKWLSIIRQHTTKDIYSPQQKPSH